MSIDERHHEPAGPATSDSVEPVRRSRWQRSTEQRLLRGAMFRGRPWWIGTIGWLVYLAWPVIPGWFIGAVFDEFQRAGTTTRAWVLIGLLAVAELVAIWGITIAHRQYMGGLESIKALMRANVLDAQLASGGPRATTRDIAVGDALVRLRDDPFDFMFLLDNWFDLLSTTMFTVVAGYFLWQIDPLAATVGIVPLLAVGVGNRAIAHLAHRYRLRARIASSRTSDFLASVFEASLTVKVAGAQPGVLRRLDELNKRRARAAVGDGVWHEAQWSINSTIADVFIGLALVVAARGELTAGEVTEFFVYLAGIAWLPMRIGSLIAGRRRAEVSGGRLDALVGSGHGLGTDPLLGHRPLPVLGGPDVDGPSSPPRIPIERLDVTGLTVGSRHLDDINFSVERGELVVLSGPVGSGKSSVLRAVIGLLPIDGGEVRWNGELVTDQAAFFIPPQSAYVAQVPRLFAEALVDNLRLGHDLSDDDIATAIELAAFDTDVAEFPEGLQTPIGARGVRLSGGQAQRAAAARAIAQRPELLVLDDLTSALDVDTEVQLWERLAAAGFTVLATSNRPVALARADKVIRLGSVTD